MKAWLIEYEFSIEDWDSCKGTRTRYYTNQALLVEFCGRKAITVYTHCNGFIFPVTVEKDDTLKYGALDFDIPLPQKVSDYKIVREIDIDEKLAGEIIEAAHLIDKVFDARRRATSFLLKLRDKK